MKYTDWIYLLGVLAMVGIAGVYLYFWRREREGNREKGKGTRDEGQGNPKPTTQNMTPLLQGGAPREARRGGDSTHTPQLTTLSIQAYERMVVFAERCGFQSLIGRMPAGNLSARQLADVYLEAIQTEFEHNLAQQIYISEAGWQSICDMKDQQCFIINQLVTTLPENASGVMLTTAMSTFMNADEKASIQPLVLMNLKAEAKKNLLQS